MINLCYFKLISRFVCFKILFDQLNNKRQNKYVPEDIVLLF
jgi:hypothetical protein